MDFIQGLDPSKLVLAGTVFMFLSAIIGSLIYTHPGSVISCQSFYIATVQLGHIPLWYICAREHGKRPTITDSESPRYSSDSYCRFEPPK